MPFSNSSSSLAMAEGSPSTRAMPSPHSVTVPTSSREAASGSYASTNCARASRISSGRIVSSAIFLVSFLCVGYRLAGMPAMVRQLPGAGWAWAQPASLRRTAARRDATLASISSSPTWMVMPPMTVGSITMLTYTS